MALARSSARKNRSSVGLIHSPSARCTAMLSLPPRTPSNSTSAGTSSPSLRFLCRLRERSWKGFSTHSGSGDSATSRSGSGVVRAADPAAKDDPEDRGQPLLAVQHEQRPGLDRPGRLGDAPPGRLVGRADVPGAGGERGLRPLPGRLPEQQRPHRVGSVERIVQGAHAFGRPDEAALEIGQVQPAVPLERRQTDHLPRGRFQTQWRELAHALLFLIDRSTPGGTRPLATSSHEASRQASHGARIAVQTGLPGGR